MTSPSTDRRFASNSSLAIKAPCRVATTAAITLSGEQTIDGVAVVTDDRVLVKNQTDQTQNGIYIADTSTWNRAPDFDGNRDPATGSLVFITSGTTNALNVFRLSTANPVVIGTSNITWVAWLGSQATATFDTLTVTTTLTSGQAIQWLCFAVTDETGAVIAGTGKFTFRLPACTILAIPRSSVRTASSSGLVTVDINAGGTTILGANKLSIDANEKTSTTAATATTLATSTISDDTEITIDVDAAGTGADGLKVYMKVRWT